MSKQTGKKVSKVKSGPLPKAVKKTLLDRLEEGLSKKQKTILSVSLLLSFLFSLLLFDVKISDANDDALYIQGGYDFAKDIHHAFTANAPLYPLLLSIPISVFGLNLVLLKFISVIFMQLHILFLFLAFRKRVPYVVLFPVLFIIAVNSYFQYFASLTFTESFFLFLQALFIFYFFKVYDRVKEKTSLKENWMQWLLLGFFIFLLSFCKNIAIGALGAIIIFFIFEKRYLYALYSVLGFIIASIPFEIIKRALWGGGQSQFSSQISIFLQKDPYSAAKGLEDFSGFIQRFLGNCNIYISKRLFQILGLRSADAITTKGGFILIFLIFCFITVYWVFRNKQRFIGFICLYFFIMMSLTFAVLQVSWDQPRLVMVYVPLILLAVFYGIYSSVIKKSSFTQFFYLSFIVLIFCSGFFTTMAKSSKNYFILKKNIAGDIYYGYTPDWINYLKMSAWCGDSLPEGSFVGARKAPMSFVYSRGKSFYPIYSAFSSDADTILANFKNNKVTHLLVANLRRNPKRADGMIINTIQRLMYPIMQKYPDKLVFIKQIGETEPAYVYKINY